MTKSIWVGMIIFACAVLPLSAKIGDPSPTIDGDRIYLSHSHTVTAKNRKTGGVLWETQIPMDEYSRPFDPNLERDVQWNIICSIRVLAGRLKVMNSKGEIFFLDRETGKLLVDKRPITH